MIDPFVILRVIIFTSLVVAAICWLLLPARGKLAGGYAVMPLSLIIHAALFFGVRLFLPAGTVLPATLNLWSSIIYLHAAFLAVGSALILLVTPDPDNKP